VRPLAGIRIVDLTTNMSGPLATMILADQGADVVKVEPPAGDAIRTVGTGHAGMSAYFANNNRRGKRSIAIDLTKAGGREVVEACPEHGHAQPRSTGRALGSMPSSVGRVDRKAARSRSSLWGRSNYFQTV
jgi:hypothetical protein